MKRWIAALLCLMLMTGCAFAEDTTRVREMILEGTAEEVTETLYRNEAGYSLWYPSEYLQPGKQYSHPCFYPAGDQGESGIYFLIVEAEANPADAEGLLAEAVGGFGPDAVISEAKWTTTESGALLGSIQAAETGVIYRFYLVTDEWDELLMITACFPEEAAEGFGVRFDRLAETIAFDALKPDAEYAGDGYSIGYFAGLLEPSQMNGHETFVPADSVGENEAYFMIVKTEAAYEQADSLLAEAVGGYEAGYEITGGTEETLESGLSLNWVQAKADGRTDRYYLIGNADAVYCITASFPDAGETDYGALFDAMAETFEITKSY